MPPTESAAGPDAHRSPGDPALPAWRVGVAGALCIGGIALLWIAATDGRFTSILEMRGGERRQMWKLFGAVLVAGVVIARVQPRLAHRWFAAALTAWCFALFGLAAVVTVAALGGAAAMIGWWLLVGINATRPDPLSATMAGAVAIAAVIGATAAIKWHAPATYALALTTSAIALRRQLPPLLQMATAWWAPRPHGINRASLLPLALLAATLSIHAVIAAKPEVGPDALGMHLQVASEMAAEHRFRFDVGTYVWAVMPMAADWLYAAAFQFGAEPAARLVNFGAFGLVLAWIGRLASTSSTVTRGFPWALAALFASMPLAFAETSSLFIENYWTALLLAATWAGERAWRERSAGWAIACLWLAAGALQAKVIGLAWVAPLLLGVAWSLRDRLRAVGLREWTAIAIALVVLAWPYANAWWRTGNPVFPFMNATFRSPQFESNASFNNAAYNAPLTWRTWYDVVVDSGRFVEGTSGAAGLHWLVLFPALFLLVRRDQVARVGPLLALAAAFWVATWMQQSYLRYLYPAFALLLALAGRIIEPLPLARPALAVGLALPIVVANLDVMPSGAWWNSALCLACSFDRDARARYIDRYADQRTAVDWLTANAPGARVGWLRLEFAGPAGFTGPMWRASWHDYPAWRELRTMVTADQVASFARQRGTDFFVLPRLDGALPLERAVTAFRDQYTTPLLVNGDTVLARWADTPDRRLMTLPADFDRVVRNGGATLERDAVAFAIKGLLWTEFPTKSHVLTYKLVAACTVGAGRGVVETVWLDDGGRTLRTDTYTHGCNQDGRVAEVSLVGPAHAKSARLYVGSAADAPFRLTSFTVSAR